MKIKVSNFQSIVSAELEINGFTAITGPSNLGKSALIRAIGAAIFGLPGDSYIRHGCNSCGIALRDGSVYIKWIKVASGKQKPGFETFLEVNGQKYTKMAKEHFSFTEPFGFKEIDVTGFSLRPQIAQQHDNIFLVGENEAAVAEVFKVLGRIDVITEAQRLAKKSVKESESVLKIRQDDKEKETNELARYERIPDLRRAFDSLIAVVKASKKRHEELSQKLVHLEAYRDCSRFTASVPNILDYSVLSASGELLQVLIGHVREFDQLSSGGQRSLPELSLVLAYPVLVDDQIKGLKEYITLLESSDEQDLNTLDARIAELKTQEKAIKEELKICPLCDSDLTGVSYGH